MAMDHAALLEVLDVLKAGDRVRVAAETMYQALIDTEVSAVNGAGPWERSPARTNQRNGASSRTLSTPAGDLALRIGEAARRVVLPRPFGSSSAGGSCVVRGGDGGL